jgi:hypothetical protein
MDDRDYFFWTFCWDAAGATVPRRPFGWDLVLGVVCFFESFDALVPLDLLSFALVSFAVEDASVLAGADSVLAGSAANAAPAIERPAMTARMRFMV